MQGPHLPQEMPGTVSLEPPVSPVSLAPEALYSQDLETSATTPEILLTTPESWP